MSAFDYAGQIFAFILTLAVFSYFIGDNPFYRLAIHMFLGVAAAYATIVVLQSAVIPQAQLMLTAVLAGDWFLVVLLAVPWLLGVLLLLRASAGLAPIGNVAIAVMVGVGAALAVGGAITGTLIPQVFASWDSASNFNIVPWFLGVLGTTTVLLYFLYIGRKSPGGRGERPIGAKQIAWVGQGFLAVALAALYVGALAAYFSIFVERVGFIYEMLKQGLSALNIKL